MAGQPAQFQEFAHLANAAASPQGDRDVGRYERTMEQVPAPPGTRRRPLLAGRAVGLFTLPPMAEPATGDAQLFGLLALRKAGGGA